MARESQETTVKRWQDRIATAKKWRDRKAQEYGWERFISEYKGNYDVWLGSGENKFKAPAINQVFAMVQTDISYLYFRDPYITLRPTKAATAKGAAILEAAINYYWRTLNQKEEIESQLIDADLIGHAWNKDGYYVQGQDEGMYSMKVSWRDVIFNVGSRRPPYDTMWLAHRIIKPLDTVKKMYPGTSDLRGSTHPHMEEGDIRDSVFKDDIDFCVLWEIWDVQKRETCLIAEGLNSYLKKPTKWPDYYKTLPFNLLWWYENPDEPYPMGTIAPVEPQILEEIKLFAQALNHVKRFNRQMLYKGNLMSEAEQDKFEQGNDGAMIKVDVQGSIQDSTKMVDYGPLPVDIYLLLDRIRQLKNTTSGQPEFAQGGQTKTATRTLGELEGMAEGAKTRVGKRVDRLETHIENIAKNMIGHIQANFDVKKLVKITGFSEPYLIENLGDAYDEKTKTVLFDKNDVQGDYEVEVRAGSTIPLTREGRMAMLREARELLMKTNGPIPEVVKVIVCEYLKDLQLPQIKEAFDMEQIKNAEVAQLKSGELSVDAAKTTAETQKRQAQARQINLESALMESQLQMPTRLMAEHEMGIVPQEQQAEPMGVPQ